jgi:hypothetical protein
VPICVRDESSSIKKSLFHRMFLQSWGCADQLYVTLFERADPQEEVPECDADIRMLSAE